jgi:hypothetical protein
VSAVLSSLPPCATDGRASTTELQASSVARCREALPSGVACPPKAEDRSMVAASLVAQFKVRRLVLRSTTHKALSGSAEFCMDNLRGTQECVIGTSCLCIVNQASTRL